DKDKFRNWNKEVFEWKKKKIDFVKKLENIPPLKKKKYFEKFKGFNRIYENYFQLCNDLFATEESINHFYRKGDSINAKEMERELDELIGMVGETAEDFLFVQQDIEHITYNFDIADYLNKERIGFSKNFYFDISR
ncbi:MAG TPA: hypothetical protein VJ895_00155, partial [Candidatus Nanoarchaeia archaeon]|nr:hypothetical protein [Candidatus Nanoarchaeia archaeon]